MTGKVGADLTTEQGAEAAKFVALNILATLKGQLFSGLGLVRIRVQSSSPSSVLRAPFLSSLLVMSCFNLACVSARPAAELGDLDKVKKIVKLTGFVNCVDGFTAQPKVVNGASDTFVAVLGEKGKHSRSAVGTNALPLNVPVEIEAIVEVEA